MHPERSSVSKQEQRRWTLFWRESDVRIRLIILILASGGVAGVAIGIILDIRGIWSKLPFTTNLVSGVTGACFGVIFALVILQSVTRKQAEAQSRRQAEPLYRRGLADLEAAARGLFSFASEQ